MKTTCLALTAIILAGCSSYEPAEPAALTEISTILASPSAYDGALVRIKGAAVVEFEASFICPSSEVISSWDRSKECLWLVPGESDGKAYDVRLLHQKTVEIVGRFNAKQFGHGGMYGGSIAAIWGKATGLHNAGQIPPPPPEPPGSSANNSFKPKPLRGSA
ncbi:hypothetical protein [Lysobacter sp. CFH 32150]|uniref:hypothetical protein n=1 Tax=Lysobacter sp. CFH 32150 TaxID=2927128 RepID=UPI001FA7444A|nr:hypothetical protein [Lysobacter sp. CFH 32150]MCI4569047.1 hypothetical protein [Lysobacter sp. CFH 32150]